VGKGNKTNCIYCYSSNVIKHGTTSKGKHRLRCRTCNKTWVIEKNDYIRPDFCQIVEKYIEGSTCRELVSLYHSSPLRINQKIRNFLQNLPNWEEYLDISVRNHNQRIIFLLGKKFACNCNHHHSNSMFLAFAIDAVSSVVLGFEIGGDEEYNIWAKLLNRMKRRKILAPSFLTNGSKITEEAINSIYPKSTVKIFINRFIQDIEQDSYNYYIKINDKFCNEAINSYNYLEIYNNSNYLQKLPQKNLEFFCDGLTDLLEKRFEENFQNKYANRLEGFVATFQKRFEKFHMLKCDPYPIINGWIAENMLKRLDIGFSLLSLYLKIPVFTSFKNFTCGNLPYVVGFDKYNKIESALAVELAMRQLFIKSYYSKI